MSRQRVIVITGGSSGIGLAAAHTFTQSGDRVVIIGREREKLERATRTPGTLTSWKQADVSQKDQVQQVVQEIFEEQQQIDVLVNCAGSVLGVETSMPFDKAVAAWDAVLAANLTGCFLMAAAIAPHLPRPGGRIISISSIAAFTGGSKSGSTAYAAAKAGVLGMTYGLARELSSEGITVNAIAPGFIAETGFTGDWPQERVNEIVSQTPVGRGGKAEDIAAAIYYLASPEASFVTGEVLNINGGWLFGH